MKHEEWKIQIDLCNYIDEKYPDTLYTASIAGLKLPKQVGYRLSQMGYLKGCFDLLIEEPNKGYHGLRLEVKTEKGKPTKEQLEVQKKYRERNYKAEIIFGIDEGKKELDNYLILKKSMEVFNPYE